MSEDLAIENILNEKNGGNRLFLKKMEAFSAELKEKVEEAISSHPAKRQLWQSICFVARNNWRYLSRCLVHEFS